MVIGLAVVLLASLLVGPVLAGSEGASPTEDGDNNVNRQVPDFTYDFGAPCEGDRYRVVPQDLDQDPIEVPADQVQETDGKESTQVRFELPGLLGGQYTFERYCSDDQQDDGSNDGPIGDTRPADIRPFAFSSVELTKSVEGDPPDDSFTINTVCTYDNEELLNVDRVFDADGGSDQVVLYEAFDSLDPVICTISEEREYERQTVTIEPSTLEYNGYSYGSSTVTNRFEPAPEPSPEPSPSPEPEPSPSPTEDVDDTVEEAEPAEPVETEPDFTG